MGGAIPFLISWGNTPHPALAVPRAGELLSLQIRHPQADLVKKQLEILGVDLNVHQGAEFQLIAQIKTSTSVVELR